MAGFSFEDALAPPADQGKGGGFSFEDAIAPPKEAKAPEESAMSTPRHIAAGLYGNVADTLGMPVDAAHYLLSHTPGFLGGAPMGMGEDLAGGSESIKRGMGKAGVYTPESLPATTMGQRIAQGAGAGIGAMFAPEAAVGALGKLGAISPDVAKVAREFTGVTDSLPQAAKTAAVGAASGAGASTAEEAVPEPYKPLAGLVGGLVTGVPAAVATESGALARTAGRAVGDLAAPLTEQGQQRIAATTIRDRASDAEDVLQSIAEGKPPLVKDSQPTTFQQTGDMGLGGLEREVQARNPEPFQQRRADQNAARTGALGEIAPTGAVSDATDLFRNQLLGADQQTEQAVNAATENARTALDSLGGKLSPEEYGSALRGVAEKAEQASKGRERSLWEAIDPDGTLELPMDNAAQAAAKLKSEVDPAAGQQLSPVENRLLDAAADFEGPQPFDRLQKFRSELAAEIRAASGATPNPQAVRRFTILKGAVDQDIEDAVAGKVASEKQAVAAGQMAPEETMEARFAEQAAEWKTERAGQGVGARASGAPSLGEATSSPALRGPESPGGEPSGNAGDQGLQGAEPVEPLPAEATARYQAARQATIDYHKTFDNGPVGAMLGEQKGGGYKLLDSAVPAKVFHSGPTGFEDVTSFRKAVGDETALPVLTDYAVSDMRRAALRPDGTVDPAGLARWQAKNAEALRAFPELAAKLSDVSNASQAMADAAELRKQTLDAFQGHAAAKLMNATSPEDAVRIIGGMFNAKNSVQQIKQLVDRAGGDQNALAGLRNAVAEYMKQKLISNTEAGTSGTNLIKSDQFQTFVRQNVAALRQLFSPEEIASLNNIAADLNRANRSLTAVKIPGSSNTPQDLLANAKTKNLSVLSSVALEAAAAGAGALAGGLHGGLASAGLGVMGLMGARVANALRDAGMKNVDQILTKALLNPEFAGQLLRRFPQRPEITIGPTITRNLRRLSVADPLQAAYPNQ